MAFQKQVNKAQALGSAGQIARAYHHFCNVVSGIASESVEIGSFCQSVANATNENEVKSLKDGVTGDILGVVLNDKLKVANSTRADLTLESGSNLQIIDAGSVFIYSDEVAHKGDFVLVKADDGSLAFSDSDSETGYVFTGWRVFAENYQGVGVVGITTARSRGGATEYIPEIISDDPELVQESGDEVTLRSRGNFITIQGDEALWQMN